MKTKTKSEQLYYHYDEEADVFYLSQGKPSLRDRSMEQGDDVILRTDSQGRVRGFTVLNFSKRQNKGTATPIKLPIIADWVAA